MSSDSRERYVCPKGYGRECDAIAQLRLMDSLIESLRKDNADGKERERRLMDLATQDPLTGLYTREYAIERIRTAISDGQLSDNPDWLVIIDMDDFKEINDANGKLAGDAMLCMVADDLRSTFPMDIIGRLGGDDFILYARDCSREELKQSLDDINAAVREVYHSSTQVIPSCSKAASKRRTAGEDSFERLFGWSGYSLAQLRRDNGTGFIAIESEADPPDDGDYASATGVDSRVVRNAEQAVETDEDLVMFVLELLGGVSDIEAGLRMTCDRICRFYHISDVVDARPEPPDMYRMYHWSSAGGKNGDSGNVETSQQTWEGFIESRLDEYGSAVLTYDELSHLRHTGQWKEFNSVFFVRCEISGHGTWYIGFVDKYDADRHWSGRLRTYLCRLAGIVCDYIGKHLDQKQKREVEQYRQSHDWVTGLPTYPLFCSTVAGAVAAHPESRYFISYADLTGFQHLNEQYGYSEGDTLLRKCADFTTSFSSNICACRMVSDHFVAFWTAPDENALRDLMLDEARKFFADVKTQYSHCNVNMIAGIAPYHAGDDVTVVMDQANIARKYVKGASQSQVLIFDDDVKARNDAEKNITARMTDALKNGEFEAWLQPKVSLADHKVAGAEALVRWRRADGSMIYPDSFIPIFEKNGFITNIDFEVLDQTLRYLREAIDSGEEVVPVSVNFSRRHNENPDFVDKVLRHMDSLRIPHELIEAEITESIFMLDISTLTENLKRFRDNGVAISIDDFGSGYSSLNMLVNVDADIIKMDKQFLSYDEGNSKGPALVASIVHMMKRMGYQVLAEGVETKEQLDLLNDAECDLVQGYYYAKPMPIPEFRKFLKEFNADAAREAESAI